MKIGMLWFDNDTKTALDARIERAASYYRNKYGKAPTLCYVHPSMLPDCEPEPAGEVPGDPKPIKHAGVEIRPMSSVRPNHFWIGVNGVNGSGD